MIPTTIIHHHLSRYFSPSHQSTEHIGRLNITLGNFTTLSSPGGRGVALKFVPCEQERSTRISTEIEGEYEELLIALGKHLAVFGGDDQIFGVSAKTRILWQV